MTDLQIFMGAPESGSPEALQRYFDAACGDDRDLRERVESLYQASLKATRGFLDSNAQPFAQGEQIGDTIGGYKLIKLIGEGGFGKVRKAIHKITRQTVAVKVCKVDHYDREQLEAIQREI